MTPCSAEPPRAGRRAAEAAMWLLSSPICGPAAMLLVSARPGVIRMAAGSPEFAVRPAKWPDDYDAVCAVRKPTEFVVEDGGAGFMGQRVAIVCPEEAQQRRVQARLSSVLRDNATVLLVEEPPGGGSVVGTLDCVLVFRRVFEPRHDLAIYFDTIASASIVFGPFLTA